MSGLSPPNQFRLRLKSIRSSSSLKIVRSYSQKRLELAWIVFHILGCLPIYFAFAFSCGTNYVLLLSKPEVSSFTQSNNLVHMVVANRPFVILPDESLLYTGVWAELASSVQPSSEKCQVIYGVILEMFRYGSHKGLRMA